MAQAMPAPFFILYAILHKMVDNLSGLMPPHTPHHISFFYCFTTGGVVCWLSLQA